MAMKYPQKDKVEEDEEEEDGADEYADEEGAEEYQDGNWNWHLGQGLRKLCTHGVLPS